MLKLEEQEYDLNFLCSFTFDFQMLKDILFKLAQSNHEMQKKIKKLEKSNKEKDRRLTAIEEQFNILYIPEQNSNLDSEENEDDKKKEEKEATEDKKEIKMEEKENNNKPIIKKEVKYENQKENEEEDEKLMNPKRSLLNKKSLRELETRNSFIQQFPQVSHETIKSLLKLIRENSEKIGKMEKSLTKKLNKAISNFENNYNDLNNENSKDHKVIYEKIKNITDKLYDYENKIDGIIVKTAPLDTLSIFRDNGNGNIDATKVMVKMLEEKVNRKIEIIEKKSKKDIKDDDAFKQKISELENLINQINQELMKQNEKNKSIEGDNNYDEEIKKLQDLIEQKYNDLLKIIEDLSTKIKNGDLVGDKLDELINKIKAELGINISKEIEVPQKKISENELGEDNGNNNLSELKNKIKELNKKLNDIDSYFKNLFNNSGQDIGELKRKVKEIDSTLEKKITKDEIKGLQNKSEEYNDAIQFLQGSLGDINQNIVKLSENNTSFMKRVESLAHEMLKIKGKDIKEGSSKPIDINRFVDENRLKEVLKNINKKIDDLIIEKNYLLNNIKEINDDIKLLETKDRIGKFEDDINTRLEGLMDKISKKYVEKIDINKYIKSMDIKLKLLDNQQKDSDSWILAKKPIGCFNCASCEANIKTLSTTNEYVPWNKYPQGERQYNMGQGFSRLLQKIGNDNSKYSPEKKEISSDNEYTKTNYFNNMQNIKGNNGHFFFRVNNRETMKEELADNNFRYIKKYKLPNLKNKRKKNDNLPLTDEENELKNNSVENPNNSPQIMKITKKSMDGKFGLSGTHQKTMNVENKNNINSSSIKSKTKLERIQSLPIYDNA